MRLLTAFSSLCVVLTLVVGCASLDTGAQKRSLYVDAHPDLDSVVATAILNGHIMVGMTEDMVQASWGKPSRTEKLAAQPGSPTHWIYGNYFVGGTITDLYFDKSGALVRFEVNSQSGASPGDRIMTAQTAPPSTDDPNNRTQSK